MKGRERSFVLLFKEFVYASFTGFAIITVVAIGGHHDPAQALVALVLGVVGIIVAGFVADIVAHTAVHGVMPEAREFGLLAGVGVGGLLTAVVPVILLALAALGLMDLEDSLIASVIIYIVTFGGVGWLAIRGATLSWWKQLIALACLIAVGFAVVGIQALAHGA